MASVDIPLSRLKGIDVDQPWTLRYVKHLDTLYVRPGKPRPAISVSLDDETWIRVDPEVGTVVGIEIEDFTGTFLPTHPDIASEWATLRGGGSKRLRKGPMLELLFRWVNDRAGLLHHEPIRQPA